MSINLVQHRDLGNFQHTITRAIAPESAQLLNNSALQMLQAPIVYAKDTWCIRKKRPTVYAKETYCIRKRDLSYTQKRPIVYAEETYYIRKRDLLYTQQCAPALSGRGRCLSVT